MNPDKIPDLHWNLLNTYHTTNIGQTEPQTVWVSTHCIYIDTLTYMLKEIDVEIGVEQP